MKQKLAVAFVALALAAVGWMATLSGKLIDHERGDLAAMEQRLNIRLRTMEQRMHAKLDAIKPGSAAPDILDAAGCKALAAKHGTVPGVTWGTLSVTGKKLWTKSCCDQHVAVSSSQMAEWRGEDGVEHRKWRNGEAVCKAGVAQGSCKIICKCKFFSQEHHFIDQELVRLIGGKVNRATDFKGHMSW